MIKAIVAIGLLGLGQAYINSQTRARRSRLGGAVERGSLQNWEDEGGAVMEGSDPALASASQLPKFSSNSQALSSVGGYPSAGQTG
jgi:hypothetical protein